MMEVIHDCSTAVAASYDLALVSTIAHACTYLAGAHLIYLEEAEWVCSDTRTTWLSRKGRSRSACIHNCGKEGL